MDTSMESVCVRCIERGFLWGKGVRFVLSAPGRFPSLPEEKD